MALPCWVAGLGRPALKDILGSCSAREMSLHTQRSLQSKAESESESEVTQSCPTLCDPTVVAYQVLPSMGFSRQEYWSGLPFLLPGGLLDPGIEPGSPGSQVDSLPSEPPGKPPEDIVPLSTNVHCLIIV